ncbi:hypothetical protein JW998_08390 [candidate division KSB1 bacterium]|nr:hypothetical protein [candidate division KSB1 bacterium]
MMNLRDIKSNMRLAFVVHILSCTLLVAQPARSLDFVPVDNDSDIIALIQDHANDPFSKEVRIQFQVGGTVHVIVKITTLQGEVVRQLMSSVLSAGLHTITWDGRCDDGQPAASGVFMYEIQTERITRSATCALLY